MSAYLKTEVQNSLSGLAQKVAVDGWTYQKSQFRYDKKLAKDITLSVHPRLSFTGGGLFCLSQPMMVLRSKFYEAIDKQALGKGRGSFANQGPVTSGLTRNLGLDHLFRSDLRDRYSVATPQFIEMDVPDSKFTPENGYFQSEEISNYVDALLKSSQAIADQYDTSSDRAFIAGLPRHFRTKKTTHEQFLGSVTAFALIEISKGNQSVISDLMENPDVYPTTKELELLKHIDSCKQEIPRI